MDYKAELLKLLGLQADSTDEQIQAACTKGAETMNKGGRFDELKGRHDTLLNAQVEADLKEHADRIAPEAKDGWKKQLLENRDAALPLLKGIKPSAAPVHNRNGARTPSLDLTTSSNPGERMFRQAQAVQEMRTANKCSFGEAFELAQAKHPDLFKEEKAA